MKFRSRITGDEDAPVWDWWQILIGIVVLVPSAIALAINPSIGFAYLGLMFGLVFLAWGAIGGPLPTMP